MHALLCHVLLTDQSRPIPKPPPSNPLAPSAAWHPWLIKISFDSLRLHCHARCSLPAAHWCLLEMPMRGRAHRQLEEMRVLVSSRWLSSCKHTSQVKVKEMTSSKLSTSQTVTLTRHLKSCLPKTTASPQEQSRPIYRKTKLSTISKFSLSHVNLSMQDHLQGHPHQSQRSKGVVSLTAE